MNTDSNEALKDFVMTGEACFNCKNYLTCKKISSTGGLKCDEYNKGEEVTNEAS